MSIDNATLTPVPRAEAPPLEEDESLLRAGILLSDKYRLESPLGRGSMGEVWLAIHERLRTHVAIKFLSLGGNQNPHDIAEYTARFEFEAQISAQLSRETRHVVAVHDVASYAGLPYLVMEFVRGHTLESVMERQALEPGFVANVIDQVSDALMVAHRLGIVHRDIKPSNIMITETESGALLVKVADFGVAKAVRQNSLRISLPKDTGQGVFVGSPMYMSPEQLRADGSLDWRSDMWSLAVVAYEALTRQAPFSGKTMIHMMVAVTDNAHAPPSTHLPSLPPALDAWFERALAKAPEARFESLGQMVAAFRAALPSELLTPQRSGFPASLRAPRRQRSFRIAVAVAGVGVLAIALFLLFNRSHDAANASTPVLTAAPQTNPSSAAAPIAPDTIATAAPSSEAPAPTASARSHGSHGNQTPTPAHSTPVTAPPPTVTPSHHKEIDPSEIH